MCEGVVDRQVQGVQKGDVDTEKVVLLCILTLRRVLLCIEQDGGGMKRDVIDHIQPRDQSPGGGTTGLSGENQIS